MYWQVYMHKAVVSSDILINTILNRARNIYKQGNDEVINYISPYLAYFIQNPNSSIKDDKSIECFTQTDDSDIWNAVKVWSNSSDEILSYLSNCLINRHLAKVKIQDKPFTDQDINNAVGEIKAKDSTLSTEDILSYYIRTEKLKNKAYSFQDDKINILFKDGQVKEICNASDQLDEAFLRKEIKKYYLYKLPVS